MVEISSGKPPVVSNWLAPCRINSINGRYRLSNRREIFYNPIKLVHIVWGINVSAGRKLGSCCVYYGINISSTVWSLYCFRFVFLRDEIKS